MEEAAVNPTHSFSVEEAVRYGSIEKALIVKEIRGMQVYKQRNGKSGWVYYSAQALATKFPYMKRASIERWLKELIEAGELEGAINNKNKYDRTRSYRLVSIAQNEESNTQTDESSHQNEQPIPSLTASPTPPHSISSDSQASRDDTTTFEKIREALGQTAQTRFLPDRQRKLKSRLRTFTAAELVQAARNLAADDFMMGRDEKNTKRYATVDYLLRSDQIVDRWLNVEADKGVRDWSKADLSKLEIPA